MRVRLRAPGGQSVLTLNDDATVDDLVRGIAKSTSIESFDIKHGYPPQPFVIEHLRPELVLRDLSIQLNNDTLIISVREDKEQLVSSTHENQKDQPSNAHKTLNSSADKTAAGPISLRKKSLEDVPELPMPGRGSTLSNISWPWVMPDDNSCLFRAFAAAVLPGDDLSMTELRSLVASEIQANSLIYTKVVLEQEPDDYCRWIQTEDAWGGAIELNILAGHFGVEICSVDVQSLRIDQYNEGSPTRCILVYSGIHYDTIVQSPSDPPHTRADNPPEFDKRIWESNDDDILLSAQSLCRLLRDRHYYTDTAGMAIRCNNCGLVVHGEHQAQLHATQSGHYDMGEVVA